MNSRGRTARGETFAAHKLCGADRDRTDDLRLAKPALSQLSYSPVGGVWHTGRRVGQGRVELPTSRLSGVRSNHLSYEPDEVFVQQRRAVSDLRGIDGKRKRNEGGGKVCRLSSEYRETA